MLPTELQDHFKLPFKFVHFLYKKIANGRFNNHEFTHLNTWQNVNVASSCALGRKCEIIQDQNMCPEIGFQK